jgi:hypothetical protein
MKTWLLFLAACAGSAAEFGEFSIAYKLEAPRVGRRFSGKPTGVCHHGNGRDARWTMTGAHVVSGELPPGLVLEEGAIAGTPTKTGDYAAKIAFLGVTCAGKPLPDQTVDVTIVVR